MVESIKTAVNTHTSLDEKYVELNKVPEIVGKPNTYVIDLIMLEN